MEIVDISLNKKKQYVVDNINEMVLEDRVEIVQMIFNSPHRNNLKEKGNGTQIKLKDISDSLINQLYNYIYQKLSENENDIFV
jgi:hypothetical protein